MNLKSKRKEAIINKSDNPKITRIVKFVGYNQRANTPNSIEMQENQIRFTS
ncbi:hypothetical protein GCM10011368_31160 [Hyunsoonleella pacifica]|nr:hypothetical protein GCM10011368_31160 [Hyunsoonleella pacifica]